MILEIPGQGRLEVLDVLLDFNGTIALDGKLIMGVAEAINDLSTGVNFHVITADTHGTAETALQAVDCRIIKIDAQHQDQCKLDYLEQLGARTTLAVGNGRNDRLMLQRAGLGVALIQTEGASVEAVLAADIVCQNIHDVFAYFKSPKRLKATLRN